MRALIIRITMVYHTTTTAPHTHCQEEHAQYIPSSIVVYTGGEMKTVIRSQLIRSQVVYIVHYMYIMVDNIMSSHIYTYLSTLQHRHSYIHTHA